MAHAHVGVVGTGQISVARFRCDDTGTDLPDDETFDLDSITGVPRAILATRQAGEAPRVRSTRAPIADFDDDNVPDASDAAPYDPTRH